MVLREEERGVRDGGCNGGPEVLVERVLKFVEDEKGAAKKASALVMLYPAVKATAVEDMAVICEMEDLHLDVKLIQVNGAAVGAVGEGSGRRRHRWRRECGHRRCGGVGGV